MADARAITEDLSLNHDPTLTEEQQEIWGRGLRILARVIARSYLAHVQQRETEVTGERPSPEPGGGDGRDSEIALKEELDVA